VLPDTRVPDDYRHVQANPEQFGGLIACGIQEAAAGQQRLGHTLDRKVTVYAGDALIGTVDVWSDGSAAAFDGAGKVLGLLPSVEVAVKVCRAEHNDKAGLSSSSLN
jgi:hypothetical protein